jgi:hypothetical protein
VDLRARLRLRPARVSALRPPSVHRVRNVGGGWRGGVPVAGRGAAAGDAAGGPSSGAVAGPRSAGALASAENCRVLHLRRRLPQPHRGHPAHRDRPGRRRREVHRHPGPAERPAGALAEDGVALEQVTGADDRVRPPLLEEPRDGVADEVARRWLSTSRGPFSSRAAIATRRSLPRTGSGRNSTRGVMRPSASCAPMKLRGPAKERRTTAAADRLKPCSSSSALTSRSGSSATAAWLMAHTSPGSR